MQERTLGRAGLTVSALGYGSMGTVFAYGRGDDDESIKAIRRAHELGVTHFDTAEMYGWGEGEKLLGAALAPIRDEVTIATKFGFTQESSPNSRPDHIRDVVDSSLQRLGINTIDVLYQHVHDPEVPVEEVVGVMKEYVDAGKVRFLGLSNTTPENVRKADAVHPVSVVQTQYSIFARESESFFPVLEELGIGFVAYSPLARGFLSGGVKPLEELDDDDYRRKVAWWAPENFDKNTAIVAELTELADSKDISLSQLSIAWLLARKPYIVPIPGSRNTERVAQNIGAVDVTLSDAELTRIDEIAPQGGIGSSE